MRRRKRRHLKSLRSLTVSSASRSHSGCLLHQGMLLTPVPFVPWQSGFPFLRYNLTLKIQGQRYSSQRSIQLTHSLLFPIRASYRPPCLSFHGVKVKGTLVSVASSWLISFLFHTNWPTIPKIWQIEHSTIGNGFKTLRKIAKKVLAEFLQNSIRWRAWWGWYTYQVL